MCVRTGDSEEGGRLGELLQRMGGLQGRIWDNDRRALAWSDTHTLVFLCLWGPLLTECTHRNLNFILLS